MAPATAGSGEQRIFNALTAGSGLREQYATRTVYGTFVIELPTPRTVRALALAGFDFVVLDLEHSPYGVETLSVLSTEAHLVGLPVLARVWTADPGLIGKVLDAGANGVMVPHVHSADLARLCVEAAHYAPRGARGMSPLISYGSPASQLALGERIVVVLQIEGETGLTHCADIAAVPGVDALFVGTYDLSQALGTPGQVDSEQLVEAADAVVEACGEHVMLGVYVDDPAQSAAWSARGFRLQCVSFDGQLLLNGARTLLTKAREWEW
jgi:4-hydroxy-2-oxoheptanedioate aldolase